jgi:hypothetical protein
VDTKKSSNVLMLKNANHIALDNQEPQIQLNEK